MHCLTDKNDVIIAVAKHGKGTVFAVGDPDFIMNAPMAANYRQIFRTLPQPMIL